MVCAEFATVAMSREVGETESDARVRAATAHATTRLRGIADQDRAQTVVRDRASHPVHTETETYAGGAGRPDTPTRADRAVTVHRTSTSSDPVAPASVTVFCTLTRPPGLGDRWWVDDVQISVDQPEVGAP